MVISTKDKQWICFSILDYTIETSVAKVVLWGIMPFVVEFYTSTLFFKEYLFQ